MIKKVIFLSSYWNSTYDPDVICTKSLVNNFLNNHYEVEISTYWGKNKEHNKTIDGCRVNYVRPYFSFLMFDASFNSKNVIVKKIYFVIAKIINTLYRAITITLYPIGSAPFVKRWAKSTRSLINTSDKITLISVVNPEESLYAGYKVKKMCPNIKWIVYYLDSGTNVLPESTFEKFRRLLHNKNVIAENKALTLADKIIVMRGHYDYYTKALDASNTQKLLMADIPLLQEKPNCSIIENDYSGKIKIVYAGTMAGAYYDPKYICEFFLELRKSFPNATLDLYGVTDKDSYLRKMTSSDIGITYHGIVKHRMLENIFSSADILLFYKNERLDSVSGKFFEYLSYMKPIIYYGINGDINYNNVQRYDYGLALDCKEPLNNNVNLVVSFINKFRYKKNISYDSVKETFKMNLSSYTYDVMVSSI